MVFSCFKWSEIRKVPFLPWGDLLVAPGNDHAMEGMPDLQVTGEAKDMSDKDPFVHSAKVSIFGSNGHWPATGLVF